MAINLAAATLGTKRYCNTQHKKMHFHGGSSSPLAPYPAEAYYLIIRLPTSEMWKICYRLLLLAFVVASFPFIGSLVVEDSTLNLITQQKGMPNSIDQFSSAESMIPDQLLCIFFHDLTNEGIIKQTEQKSVFLTDGENKEGSQIAIDYNMDLIKLKDLKKQNALLDDTVDFVFTSNFPASSKFIDRTLKIGGVVTVLLNDKPSSLFYMPSNYKIAYMRRFDLVTIAMKKINEAVDDTAAIASETNFATQRKLLGYVPEAKKAALQKLEDVLLEPPRAASGKSRKYLRRTRYLPDLMGDSLESYPRRVFINAGLPEKEGGNGTDWFLKNYPTRNKNFEIYKIEMVVNEGSSQQIEMSDWLRKNVKEEEYVVMKAEAEVVEEMMRSKAIMLVDELFLECKPQGNKGNRKNRRAYWECLALYGKLRDEGVAVHQWWG